MPDDCTVVIGAQHHLDALRARADAGGEVLAFLDTDALGALHAVATRTPRVVIFERLFAASSRGAALIDRIKADPSLSFAEIRVISHDGEDARAPSAERPRTMALTVVNALPELDWRGTRRVPRFLMIAGTEAQIDGATATIVDLSTIGAQVVAQVPLKPHQRVRMALTDDVAVLRFDARVAWASFEMPNGVTQYRAGVEFRNASPDAVMDFVARHAADDAQ
jgi:PilZ domain